MSFTSVSGKSWVFKSFDNTKVLKITEEFSLNEITSRLLVIRNIDIKNINSFLYPSIKNHMPNPYQITDMVSAVNRVSSCVQKLEPVGIFGDYDVDGATSTSLLANYFMKINHPVYKYIPDRKTEGYGPNKKGFEKLIKNGSKVILTVDCGTSSFEAIKYSQTEGVDIIVLDHHQAGSKLPNAHSIVNPNRLDDKSNLGYLCAAGVCLMFLVALNKKLRNLNWFDKNKIKEPNIINFLDLVCLGTVCDVVPLIGLNRAIVFQGLKLIKKRNNLGLKTLYDICNINSQPSTYHLGYILGPRINAGGRVGKSSHGSELLISNDPEKVHKIAKDLNFFNKERQKIEEILLEKVDKKAQNNLNDPVLFLQGEDWHEGVIGIVASRMKDKYNKPTILITFDGSKGKGSARSIYGFDIGAIIITAVQLQILEKGGGHKMAGGFSINKNKLKDFKNLIIKKFNQLKMDLTKQKMLYVDTIISPSALNEEFYNNISLLSPFGPGNPEPKFIIQDVKVINATLIGTKHIKVIFYGRDGKSFRGMAFNSQKTVYEKYLTKLYKKPLNIAGQMFLNDWKGNRHIEFLIEDISIH